MSNFKPFGQAVSARLAALSQHELYTVDLLGDELYVAYLAAFPAGTNEIYKTRTEHDCGCCRNFIRNFGNVVAVIDGKVESIWGAPDAYIKGIAPHYLHVARVLDDLVSKSPINGLFRSKEASYGAEETKQLLEDQSVIRWNHFHGKVAKKHFSKTPDQVRGDYATSVAVFRRGLEELTIEAVTEVLNLIEGNALYRGAEHLAAVKGFGAMQAQYHMRTEAEKETFVWINANSSAARFRNTAIGTLVTDLSAGMDIEDAVRSFESKVAPTNYKRPTALITPRMVQDALKTIKELDIEHSLERRHARISDITVNNVLWVAAEDQAHMKGGLEGILAQAARSTKMPDLKRAEDISIEDFLATIVPGARSIELMATGTHLGNFMSLTAPVHDNTKLLFKWDNDFAWSYDGNVTDSIKERVKKAGGNVTNAVLRTSLAWFNYDDLDLHLIEPDGTVIYFGNKRSHRTGGFLDVDMNAGGGRSREPVENISWSGFPPDGAYQVMVNQFSKRETSNVGFTVEIENQGKLTQLSYPKAVSAGQRVGVAQITMKGGVITKIEPGPEIQSKGISQEKWGIKTEEFTKVRTLLVSPNHWDGNQVGNKHWFFILEGCKNPEPTRGIYNEFLAAGLEKHRKVFEVLGDKTKCPVSNEQLSGLGFSSTRGDTVTVRVETPVFHKFFNIKF